MGRDSYRGMSNRPATESASMASENNHSSLYSSFFLFFAANLRTDYLDRKIFEGYNFYQEEIQSHYFLYHFSSVFGCSDRDQEEMSAILYIKKLCNA